MHFVINELEFRSLAALRMWPEKLYCSQIDATWYEYVYGEPYKWLDLLIFDRNLWPFVLFLIFLNKKTACYYCYYYDYFVPQEENIPGVKN